MDKKRKKVERKFRMTPKMTVKVTPKRQRMILKTKGMTLKKPRMTPRTELLYLIYKRLSMTRRIPVILRMTPKMTPRMTPKIEE